MNRMLALALVLALGAGSAAAKTERCKDPTTHKFIKCVAAPATKPMAPMNAAQMAAMPSAAKPAAMASAPAPTKGKGHCRDPKTGRFAKCTMPGAVPVVAKAK